jgi:hypothetical protein
MQNVKWLMTAAFLVGACSTTVEGVGDRNDDEARGADAGTPAERPDADVTPAEPQLVVTVLSLGTGNPVINANVNCRYGEQGPNADTRHFRVFPAAMIGGSTITEAILPIEVADSAQGPQPATLKFHRLTGDILAGEFELISETPFVVPNQTLGEVRVPVALEVALLDTIVIEVSMADGNQQRNLRFGHNLEAQTGPTYYASDACGQAQPKDLATLDNPFVAGATFAANSWLVSLTTERLQ